MSHSADPVLQNPFRYPSNAVANVNADLATGEISVNLLLRPNEDGEGASGGPIHVRNGEAGLGENSLLARRTSRHETPPPSSLNLNMPTVPAISDFGQRIMNTPVHQPSPEETGIEGEMLFVNFIQEEVRNEGLDEPEEFAMISPTVQRETGGVESEITRHFRRQGQLLRQIAADFASSPERQRVHRQAESVNLENIRRSDFLQLLGGLFNESSNERNITFERIVVLFFFIRDLVVRAIQKKLNSFLTDFMKWSLAFIRNHVCQWVQDHGGWEAVLQYVFTRKLLVKAGLVLLAVGATLTLAGAFIYWQKNN